MIISVSLGGLRPRLLAASVTQRPAPAGPAAHRGQLHGAVPAGVARPGPVPPTGRKMARAGAPSQPCSLTGRQIISYRPAVTGERSSPSMIPMPASSRVRWILAPSAWYPPTDR